MAGSAGREKRSAAALEGDEQRLRRRQEEAALLLRRIKGSVIHLLDRSPLNPPPSL
jgi:meiotic recombination protein SPO11